METRRLKELTIPILLISGIVSVVLTIFYVKENIFLEREKERITKPASAVTTGSARLAIPAQDKDIIEIFNRYANSDDVIQVRPKGIGNLSLVQTGIPILIFDKHDDLTKIIELAKENGIEVIGYNLEDVKLSKEQLLKQEKEVYKLAKENGLKYIFAPLARHVVDWGADLAKNADGIAIQLRNFQLQKDFEERVEKLIAEMRASNPEIEIRAQLDTVPNVPEDPRQRRQLSVKELLKQVRVVENKVDVLSFFSRDEVLIIEEVFKELRGYQS